MSGNVNELVIGESTEVGSSGIGGGGNATKAEIVEIGVKNDVGRLLINTQTSSQDEDISNTIPLDFDAKVQYYQTNKQSIIEDWLQNMRGFHFHLSSIVLAQIGIEDSWHGSYTIPVKPIDDFRQGAYCDIMDFIIEKCRNTMENDEELLDLIRLLFGCSPCFLDKITNEGKRFSYLLQMLRDNRLVYFTYNAINNWYDGYLWDNPKGAMNLFVRQLRIQELKNVSEVQSLLLILNSLISFSAQFNQHEVGKSLQEVKELVYQQFGHLAVTHFTEGENREELGQFYLHNALDLPQELYHFVEQKGSFELGYTAYVQIFGKLCFRNPIYRISSDRAIQMDYNSITPQYFYDIGGEQLLGESELYRNIFSTVDEIFLSRPGTNDEDYM